MSNEQQIQKAETGKQKKRSRKRSKPAIKSHTIVASICIIIINLAALLGWTISMESTSMMIEAIITIAGAVYVIWRRFRTKTRVKGILATSNHAKTRNSQNESAPV